MPTVWAVSDLHGAVKTNSERIEQLTPPDPADWLIVAGDVAERTDLIIRILRQLNDRYAKVIWVPVTMSYSPAPRTGIKAEKSMRTWWKGAGKLELLLPKTRIRYSTGPPSFRYLLCMITVSVRMA